VTVGVGVEVGVGVKVAQVASQLPSLLQASRAVPSSHTSAFALRQGGVPLGLQMLSQRAWLVFSLTMQLVPIENVLRQHPGKPSAVRGVRKGAIPTTAKPTNHDVPHRCHFSRA
jgi:hypothetical protein